MFTGIITNLGRLRSQTPGGVTRLVVETAYDVATVAPGASIACNGVCLSVVNKGPGWFAVDVSAETLSCTNIGGWVAAELAVRDTSRLASLTLVGAAGLHVNGVEQIDPFLRNLRADPRYTALLRKMNLPLD